MMKPFIAFLAAGMAIMSCEKDFSPLASYPEQAVALNIDNIFYYHGYSVNQDSDSVWAVAESFGYEKVIGDTLIQNKRYFILNYNVFRRADKDKLYCFENNHEITLLNYNVQMGDTVDFYNSRVIVEDIGKRQVFNRSQTVISVSNKKLNSNTLITGEYTTQFGLLAYSKGYKKSSDGSTLLGAIINGISFGKVR